MEKVKDMTLGITGRRLTRQRTLLLNLIRQGGYPDVGGLCSRAKEQQPSLSMSTVYRSLRLFVKLGIVEEHHFNKSHSRYELKTETEHYHMICLGCGRIIEFGCPLFCEMKENLEAEHRFHITSAKVLLEGYCAACFNNRERKKFQ